MLIMAGFGEMCEMLMNFENKQRALWKEMGHYQK